MQVRVSKLTGVFELSPSKTLHGTALTYSFTRNW